MHYSDGQSQNGIRSDRILRMMHLAMMNANCVLINSWKIWRNSISFT